MNLTKSQINILLYEFLETIYQFQQKELSLFDISWEELYLLHNLKQNSLTVSECTIILQWPLFKTSRLISNLEKKGLVNKIQDKKDKRVYSCSLKNPGSKIISKIEEYHFQLIKKNFNKIPSIDIDSITKLLRNLKLLLDL